MARTRFVVVRFDETERGLLERLTEHLGLPSKSETIRGLLRQAVRGEAEGVQQDDQRK